MPILKGDILMEEKKKRSKKQVIRLLAKILLAVYALILGFLLFIGEPIFETIKDNILVLVLLAYVFSQTRED